MAAKKTARKPDYVLSFWNRRTEEKGRIGAAWDNDNGSISIVLNPFVTIRHDSEVSFALWPNDGTPVTRPSATDPTLDDVPF